MFISEDAAARAIGLRLLSLLMGSFFIFMGVDKIDWLVDDSFLIGRLQEWLRTAPPVSRWYLEMVAIPGATVFSRLVVLGELAIGMALVAGFRICIASTVAIFMVLNFHFASDVIFHYSYMTNGYGLPIIGGLLALAIGGTRLPFSLSR
jgi:uncharacterized membrane protein YphA (DoxX/SURF4 family)